MKKTLLFSSIVVIALIAGYFGLYRGNNNDEEVKQPFVSDNVKLDSPLPDEIVTSPLVIRGEARLWYFEASFPIEILDANGARLGVSFVQAQDDWMTENWVPFEGKIEFDAPTTDTGTLVMSKDNPSGLPEFDESVSIPIRFK
ncbi:MAG: Gmad2 immunoglobulin-like domain-containing protein [Candidatus Yanofskybacteria bacterium]|nr:Gmad2 immunoglobulin-like domain-containing protein [Candidatus Yanofskybacteria bacterium]